MKKMREAYHLPEGLLVEIIKRLPAKSLLRFRCVSKSWRSLISSSHFVTLHRDHNINHPCMLVNSDPEEPDVLHSDNDAFEYRCKVKFPIDKGAYGIVGTCHGLICVCYDSSWLEVSHHEDDLYLWNPSIRKIVTLPTPGITYKSRSSYNPDLGFGFDSKSDDYKVVRIVYHQEINGLKAPPEAELYELNTGTWRGITAVVPPYKISRNQPQVYVNGAVHWMASNPTKIGGFCSLIVAFDLSDGVFKEMRLPNTFAHECARDIPTAVCGGFLSLIQRYSSSSNDCCCVWVMEKYGVDNSWTKLFNIELLQGAFQVLGSRKNGELLVVTTYGELVSYDPENEQVKDLGIRGTAACSLYVSTYIESLIFIDKAYGASGYNSVPGWFGEDDSEFEDSQ